MANLSSKTGFPNVSPSDSNLIDNLSITASVAANALTIALKDRTGADATAGTPISIGFRNSTLTLGTYNVRTVVAALSMVVSSGSTLGQVSAVAGFLYLYAIDNAGAVELAISGKLYDTAGVITTIAEGGAGAADSLTAVYSTTARTSVPFRFIGRLTATEATAGTWATAPSVVSTTTLDQPLATETEPGYLSYFREDDATLASVQWDPDGTGAAANSTSFAVKIKRNGPVVVLYFPRSINANPGTGTTNMALTVSLPAWARPSLTQNFPIGIYNNGTFPAASGMMEIGTGGSINIYLAYAGGTFSGSTAGLERATVSYMI